MLSKSVSHILWKYLCLGIRNKVPFTSLVSRLACRASTLDAGEWVSTKRRIAKEKVENGSDGRTDGRFLYNRFSPASLWCTRVVITREHEDGITPYRPISKHKSSPNLFCVLSHCLYFYLRDFNRAIARLIVSVCEDITECIFLVGVAASRNVWIETRASKARFDVSEH